MTEQEMKKMEEDFNKRQENIQMVREMFPEVTFPDVEEQMIAHYARGTKLADATLMESKSILIGNFPGSEEVHEYGIISKQYKFITHEETIAAMLEIMPDFPEFGEPVYDVKVFDMGAKLKFYVDFPDVEPIEVAANDKVGMRLSGQNSYDLYLQYGFTAEALALICTNGLIGYKALGGYNTRHKQNLNLEISSSFIAGALTSFSEQTDISKSWAAKQLGTVEFKEIVDGLPFGSRHTEQIMELPIIQKETTLKALGMKGTCTLWDVNLACTQHITHNIESEMVKIDKGEKIAKYLHNI